MTDLKKLGDETWVLLRQLSGRQKGTLVAFGAIILVPLLWLSMRPGDESWLAVQDGNSYEPASLKQAEEALRESGLTDLRVEGKRIFVPLRNLALADAALKAVGLSQEETESAESPSSAFDLFKSLGTTERESQQQLHKDIERALAAVSGINAATVISSRSKPTRWNQKPEVAAAVYVTPTAGSRFTAELRNSIFASVARMIPDLVPQKIVVIDQKTGLSWTPDTNTRSSDIRADFEDQIAEALNEWIPEAEVRVLSVKGIRQPVLTRPRATSPIVKSVPNQPGAVIAEGGRKVEVDVVLPPSTLHSDDEGPKRERIIKDVKRILPSDCIAVVSFTGQIDPGVAGTREEAEQVAGSPVLSWPLLASAVGFGIAIWWFRGHRASVEPAPPDNSFEADIGPSQFVDEAHSGIVATSHEPMPEDTLEATRPLPQPVEIARPRFEYLQQTTPMAVYRLLAGEHPQTMALVLRHLPTKHATDVVSLLPSGIQSEVIRRIAEADLSDGDIVDELEQSLQTRLTSQPASCGDEASTPEQKTTPLTPLARFEQIVELSPENLKRVTEEVEESLWAEALRGSSETLRFRIIASLPPQQARSVRASLNASPLSGTDVEVTRNRIVETVNSLSLPGNSPPLRHKFVA